MSEVPPRPVRFADLGLRVASGLVLAVLALLNLWAGGAWAAAFICLALVLMIWEFHRMATGSQALADPSLLVPCVAGVVAVIATVRWGTPTGLGTLAVGAALVALVGAARRGWLVAGFLYMTLGMGALLVFRNREPEGVMLILWLVLVVVAADVGAYFVGRRVGGKKLWPAVSPGKTWSGAVGGLIFAGATGLAFGLAVGWSPVRVGLLSLGIAVCSQLGDLLESAVKRRFGVKDSSRLIPGHGGVMDRLDGIVGGIWFFAICHSLGMGAIGH
ncbi:MAG: phosphatidate cytidylyltransferase [Amaricoccus sp.]|uniref:phosphatidate cytidylyltransferase n=1 Tax=Amaricoccus sp. TaxID=1872485 RepID=UPI0039E31905